MLASDEETCELSVTEASDENAEGEFEDASSELLDTIVAELDDCVALIELSEELAPSVPHPINVKRIGKRNNFFLIEN